MGKTELTILKMPPLQILKKLINMKFFVLILLTITSCSYKKNIAKQELSQIPAWYVSPKNNNYENLYGLGEGFALEDATKSALSDAAARLFVSISSTSSILREEDNNNFNEETRQKINQNIEKIDFGNFQISQTSKIAQKFYVEVKIDRQNFIARQKERMDFLDNQINNLKSQLNSQNLIQKRISLTKILEMANESELIARITSFDIAILRQKLKIISDTKNELSKLNNKIEFFITKNSSSKIYSAIRGGLNQENFVIVDDAKNSSVIIKINSEEKRQKIYNAFITKLIIEFENIVNNKIIASNSIEISGSSLIDYENSYLSAIENLKDKIKKDGSLKILGIIKE